MIPFPVSPKFPQERIDAALRIASGLQVQWKEDAAPMPGLREDTERAWIEVAIQNATDVGWDEQRTELNDTTDPPTQRTITIGRRECTIALDAYSLTPSLKPRDVMERVRFGFNRQVVLDALQPIVAIRWCQPINTFPTERRENRVIYRGHMDVAISYIIAADTLDPAAKSYVLSVNGGGRIPGTLEP
jgi:hypothetical protein